ncbi:sensor histidine kinase [Marinoscillum furvescens]|uniref:histidine kinase n=1 Tax=Marinoscillum furvescens DSM 4134 TaxID=1122208 RepID=A0A3D9KXV2_MARFU|nr:HAMP domain-containing sensor histidine kinase [Marinoscillum furvescens]RED94062.1 phospho-acceptor domain-containing protein [Marinoscillum furvescens DSM 4134]
MQSKPSEIPKPNPLEKTLFEFICIVQSVTTAYLFVQGLFRAGWDSYWVMDLALTICGLSFYWLSKYKGYFLQIRFVLIGLLLLASIFFWTKFGGMYGHTAIGTLAVGVILTLIAPRSQSKYFTLTYFIFMACMVGIQSFTDIINDDFPKRTYATNYLFLSAVILMVVYKVKTEFDKERRKSIKQNANLEALNEKLQKSIVEKEKIIKQLSQARDQLVESEKMASVGRLTAGLAHELNNPLNYVGGNVQPIIQDLEDIKNGMSDAQFAKYQQNFEEINKLLINIMEGSQRATDVVNNLLKISPQALEKKVSQLSLNELVARTCILLQNAHPNIHFWIVRNEKLNILGNKVEINQVLLNILKNAVDAVNGKEKGKVTIDIYYKNQQNIIAIKDNGVGISPPNISKIFEPFFTTKEEGKGTGLGLYISYGIVKKHGGKITYKPQEEGSCFEISFPSFKPRKTNNVS